MAKQIIQGADLFWHGQRLAPFTRELSLTHSVDTPDATTIEDDTSTVLAGMLNTAFSMGGFWDADSAGDPDADLFSAIAVGSGATVRPLTVVPPNNNTIAYMLEAYLNSYEIGGSIGEITPASLNFSPAGTLVRGRLLFDGTDNVDGTTAGVDIGGQVGSNEELVAFLHVLNGGGSGDTLDVSIEDDDSAATERIAFDTVTGPGTTSQIKTAAGAISERSFAASYTINVGSADWRFVIAVGKRKT